MKNYKSKFLKYWKYGDQDLPQCWGCYTQPAVDIHHLKGRGMGGDPTGVRNDIYNLIPLCLSCHERTDDDRDYNEMLKKRLKRFIDGK